MKTIYRKIELSVEKYGEFIFLFLLILISIFSTTLYNNSKKKIVNEYQDLFENIYFKRSVKKLFSSAQPRFLGIRHIVKSGESLNSILSNHEISDGEIKIIVEKLRKKTKSKVLFVDMKIDFVLDTENNSIIELIYPESRIKKIVLTRNKDNSFEIKETITKLTKKFSYKEGIIKSSLYKAAKNLNIEDSIIVE